MRIPLFLLTLSALLAGCDGLEYVTHVAEGQLGINAEVEPIADVLASGRLSEEDQAKLEWITTARQFAIDEIGLVAGESYSLFYDTRGQPLAWNLSAARRDALVAHTWAFPLVGEIPYLGFFDEEYLREVEAGLQAEGYDTFTYELDAYSTLGLFEDPVRSTMLRRDELSLAETIIHELTHNTIWRGGDTTFNESLATFVGRQGAIELLLIERGEESGWPQVARDYYADVEVVNAFLLDLYATLEAYYAQPISSAEKIAGREALWQAARDEFVREIQPTLNYPEVFARYAEMPTNNAWLLGNRRYNLDLDVFARVYAATGNDWPATLAVFQAAAAAEGDPFAYLTGWLANRSGS